MNPLNFVAVILKVLDALNFVNVLKKRSENKKNFKNVKNVDQHKTRSSAIAHGTRDASCQLKSCQLPRNSAETTTSPDQIDGMKLEV